jgi:hypothetical protein
MIEMMIKETTHAHAQPRKKKGGEEEVVDYLFFYIKKNKKFSSIPKRQHSVVPSFIRSISGVYNTIGWFRFGAATLLVTTHH